MIDFSPVQDKSFEVKGGVDYTSSPSSMYPGAFMSSSNVWFVAGTIGCSRAAGYERFDGQTAPSSFESSTDQETQRALITTVTGTGDILGGFEYKDAQYVFREHASDSTARLWKSTASGWSEIDTSANRLSPGRFEFYVANFTGVDDAEVLMWVNGVDKLQSYDGTTITEITTRASDDTPTHIGVFQNRVFVGYTDGSWRCSDSSDQTDFTSTTGLSHEKYTGSAITGFKELTQNSFLVTTEKSLHLIQGRGDYAWVWSNLRPDDDKVGAAEWTLQGSRDTLFLDGMDITSLSTTQKFGDFKTVSLTQKIRPYLQARAGGAVASLTSKKYSHYRVFFSDKSFLNLAFDGTSYSGPTICEYPFQVTCTWSSFADGVEKLFAGGDDGYVYQLDSGNTFDGAAITGHIRFPYHHYGTPRNYKEFLKIIFEMDTPSGVSENTVLKATPEFSYASSDLPPAVEFDMTTSGGGGFWDIDSQYGGFAWDLQPVGETMVDIEGEGKNMGIILYFSSQYDPAFTLSSFLVDYILLGRIL